MSEKKPDYHKIVSHYESCFSEHGDTAQGMDWPNENDAQKRYQVMYELMQHAENSTLLDLGCGAGHFFDFLQANNHLDRMSYTGADLSETMIEHCKKKHQQVQWHQIDVLKEDLPDQFDFVVMNGIFTEKLDLSYDEMLGFWKLMLVAVFKSCRVGMAFNVMSTQVDWQRDDLFHLPLDTMANFVFEKLSKHMLIRKDYGLYEYTVYVYKSPRIE